MTAGVPISTSIGTGDIIKNSLTEITLSGTNIHYPRCHPYFTEETVLLAGYLHIPGC